MSLAVLNKKHEISVVAYEESEPTRLRGGTVMRTKGTDKTLKILFMHTNDKIETRSQDGTRFLKDSFTFQLRIKEAENKGISVRTGRVFIVKDGLVYRVVVTKDYSMYKKTQCYQCVAERVIPNVV